MDDPIQDLFNHRKIRIEAHERLRKSEPYLQQKHRLDKGALDFAKTLHTIWLVSTRAPGLSENALMLRRLDDAMESAIAIRTLISEGMLHPARRETRYLLEALTKYLATDQQKPEFDYKMRVAYFERKIDKKSIGPITDLTLDLLSRKSGAEYRQAVRDEYDRLSSYVHASAEQVRDKAEAAERGAYIGFETIGDFEQVVKEVMNVFSLALILVFHGIGRPCLRDWFEQMLSVNNWTFQDNKYVSEISRLIM